MARPPRAKSLLVTLWGDVLAPHGREFWLLGILHLSAALGLNSRLVRTTVFRLVDEHWLVARREGRQSRYRLTADGERRMAHASDRIYRPAARNWSGEWTLVLGAPSLAGQRQAALREELHWQGFGEFAPGLYAHPADRRQPLEEIVRSSGTEHETVTFSAVAVRAEQSAALKAIMQRAFALDSLAQRYRSLLDDFGPLLKDAQGLAAPDAFALRVMLVQAYRRVLLYDPQLPASLLPPDWPGHRAFRLTRQLYGQLRDGSERFIASVLGADANPVAAAQALNQRFPLEAPNYQ